MTHAKEYIDVMRKLVPLIRRVPKFSVWQFDILCDWFAYHWNRGTFSYVIIGDRPRGICVIKLFRHLEQFLEPFVHQPCGEFIMIEVFAADGPSVMAYFHDRVVSQWGRQRLVLWDRGWRTEGGAPRMFKFKDFERLARKITHGESKWAEADSSRLKQ